MKEDMRIKNKFEKRMTSFGLKELKVLCVLCIVLLIVSMPVAAQGVIVPGDFNGDKMVSEDELADSIMAYLKAEYLGENVDHLELDELRGVAHIHVCYPRMIVDSANRNVTIYKPIKRIIVLNRNTLETMRSLNLEKERIVGVSKDVVARGKFFPEFKDCPNVGSAWSPDIEKILELKPDAVFLYATHFETSCEEVQRKLEGAGITVVRFDCFKPENYAEEVKKLGYILEKEEADNFVEFYEGCLNSIKERVDRIPEDERPRIYFEGFGRPYETGGKGTVLHQIVEMAGGSNIFSELSGYKDVDPEEVIYRNPEIIVKQAYKRGEYGYNMDNTTELKDIRDEILSRSELEEVSAVENKKVYIIIKEITGVKHFIALAYMAKWFYPELFNDLDPKVTHQRYLTEFQGLEFDLDEHGVFVYPEASEKMKL